MKHDWDTKVYHTMSILYISEIQDHAFDDIIEIRLSISQFASK